MTATSIEDIAHPRVAFLDLKVYIEDDRTRLKL